MEFIDLKLQYKALRGDIDRRISAVLEHGKYIMGPEVYELETELSNYTGAKFCITCSSGTEALLISLMGLGIKPGDEVITTAFTFAATAETIAILGAIPVFVDIDPDIYTLDPDKVNTAITRKTKAIIPVSLYGQVPDMSEINTIAQNYNIPVIEDAAQSFGADYFDKKSCNISTIGVTSFFPSKPLGCYGDGGAIFTSNEDLATSFKEIRSHGQESRYYHTRIGVGGRMDTLQCAVVLAKLKRFDWECRRRQEVASKYSERLGIIKDKVCLPKVKYGRKSVFGQYTILTNERDMLQKHLSERDIPTAIHYPLPLHLQPAYTSLSRHNDLTVTEKLSKKVISLPMYPDLNDEDICRISEIITKFYKYKN